MTSATKDRIRKAAAFKADVMHGAWLLDAAGVGLAVVQVRFLSSVVFGVASEGGYLAESGKSIQHDPLDAERMTMLCKRGKSLRMAGDEFPVHHLRLRHIEEGAPVSFDLSFEMEPVRMVPPHPAKQEGGSYRLMEVLMRMAG